MLKNFVRIGSVILALLCFFSVSGADDVLFFGGGRMFWAGTRVKALKWAGAKVKLIDSTKLDGFGGASTKARSTDPVEPPKEDGITPEFKRLNKYKVVFFSSIPPKLLKEMLNQERIEKLREYVANGGAVLLNYAAPETLGDLLPVKFTGEPEAPKHQVIAERPRIPGFELVPEKWEKLYTYRPCEAVNGAEVLGELYDQNGKVISVGFARMPYGKGEVWFFNGDWANSGMARRQFQFWAYTKVLMCGLVSAAGKLNLDVAKVSDMPPTPPERKQHDELTFKVDEAKYQLTVDNSEVKQNGNAFEFGNKIIIRIRKDGRVEVVYPDAAKDKIKLKVPQIRLAGAPQPINRSEAIVDKFMDKKYSCVWSYTGAEVKDNSVELSYSGSDGSKMRWVFTGGELDLDGRKYSGIKDHVEMDSMPILLESLAFEADFPESSARRMASYANPRGHISGKLDRENGLKDLGRWVMFVGGQPFTYNMFKSGVLLEFPDRPVPCEVRQQAFQSSGSNRVLRQILGRQKTPASTPGTWHFFSPGPERGNNDFMGVWQFVRQYLRAQAGIKTFPKLTTASLYLHGISPEKKEKAIALAAELGFKAIYLFFGQARMSQPAGEGAKWHYDLVRKYGMVPHAWTAGGYADGWYDEDFTEHKDFYITDRKGKVHAYGKKLPVLDFNNPDAQKWYFSIMEKAIANGLGEVYMDMMGQASSNVNYGGDSALANVEGVTKVFKFWSDHNIPFAVEGVNPLARDQALFTSQNFVPMVGQEFAYVGGTPLISADRPQLYFDYFRLLMYDATVNVGTDGLAEKFDRFPREQELVKRTAKINKVMNEAFERVPNPWVRETPFGTIWMSENTGALFFYDSVKTLNLQLPENWVIDGVEGNTLNNIEPESVIFLKKVK